MWYFIGAVLTGCLALGILTLKTETRDFNYVDDKFGFYAAGVVISCIIAAAWPFLLLPALTAVIVKEIIDRKKLLST